MEESNRLLSRQEICAKLGISLATLWRLTRRGEFPPPIRLSPGRIAWRAHLVAAWLNDRAMLAERHFDCTNPSKKRLHQALQNTSDQALDTTFSLVQSRPVNGPREELTSALLQESMVDAQNTNIGDQASIKRK